jgi:putative DNA primase/helicase
MPVAYDPAATCPAWDRFIGEVFPEDARAVAFQIVALLMVPHTSCQKAVLLIGSGGNGKSAYLAGLTAFLGRRNVSAVSLHRLESDRFSCARLLGKLANVCADLPSEHLAGTSMFKRITGGDSILAERKFCDAFEFVPFARLVFSANHPPRSADDSEAFFDRWLVIPFTASFRNSAAEIPRHELDSLLAAPNELSGVFNRALDALPAVLERGIAESATMRAARARDGLPPMTATAFGRALRRLRPRVREAQRKVSGRVCWVYLGLGLRATEGLREGK